MAIGKKSKFEEHERKSKIQAETASDEQNDGAVESGKKKKRKSSSGSSNDNEQVRVGDTESTERHVAESRYFDGADYEDEEGSEDEAEEAAKKIQSAKRESSAIRSIGSNSSPGEKGSTDAEQPQVDSETKTSLSIIVPLNVKSDTELLWDEICNGIKGKNSGIPMGFNRLNKYLGLRKSIYTTIGAAAGCGKTSLVDCAYVLNPYDWYIKNQYKSNVKFEAIYFSMERKKTYKLAKWLCMKIWKEENKLITTDELLSWQSTLDKKKQEIAKFYIDHYFKEMIESGIVKIIDGQQNPTGIFKYMKAHALTKGREEQVNQWETRYIADNDN